MTTITIQPYTLGSVASPKVATKFEVRHVTYFGPTAVADCHLRDAAGSEVSSIGLVTATAEMCAAWTDDVAFASAIATAAGFTAL